MSRAPSTVESVIADAFARLLRDSPDRSLLHHPASARWFTVRDLWALAAPLADTFDRYGIRDGRLVLTTAGNHPATFVTWLAARARGATILAVEPSSTAVERQRMADRFGAAAMLSLDVDQLGCFDAHVPGPCSTWLSVRGTDTRYAGAAALRLTSGSTGGSRATFAKESELVADTRHLIEVMEIGPDDLQMGVIPLSHAYGFSCVLLPALLQGTACVLRDAFVPPQTMADARRLGVRHFHGVPFMFDYFAEHPPEDGWPPSLVRLVSAGAPLASETINRFLDLFGAKIRVLYGATETGGITFDTTDGPVASGFVGAPLPGVSVTLRTDETMLQGTGRVHVRSDAVATRYVGETADPALAGGGFLSGDLGRFDEQGGLHLCGRLSAFLNIAGRKVLPDEVERVLRQHPAVADVRVIGAPDVRRGQQLVACLVARGALPSTPDLRRFCSERLAPFKIPRAFVRVEAIPLTDRGKTDRQRLSDLAAAALEDAETPML